MDFDTGTLSVRQALERSGGDGRARPPLAIERREIQERIAATPKRSAEHRALRQQLEANRAKWRKLRTELRFVEPKSIRTTRDFRAMRAGAPNVPQVRFHDLRHTAATLLLAQGVDPRTIMETLGHSQISLTLNTYSHASALQTNAAAKLDAILLFN